MTNYTVETAKHATLAAGEVDAVTVTGVPAVANRSLEVYNWSSSVDIWFTTNGAIPVPRADNTYFVRPGAGLKVSLPSPMLGGVSVVKLIGMAAADYSVTVS